MSRFADYAVLILGQLAGQDAARLSATDIATRCSLPEPTVAKTLKLLARAGVLSSTRGVHGGYGLARAADKITVADIVTAIDGPISLTDCADNNPCALEGHCAMHGRWGKVNVAIRTALDSVTLTDLLQTPSRPIKLNVFGTGILKEERK